MVEVDNNPKGKKLKTSKLTNLSLGFTVISVICLVSLIFTAAYTARILFLLSIIFAVALSIVSIFKIKLGGGKLKDMGASIIGGIIIPAILAGIVSACIVLGKAVDSASGAIRLIIYKKELETLGKALQVYGTDFDGKYPTADKWCDLLVQHTDVNKTSFGKFVADGHSNYAINPYAEPNLPTDIVLLFETYGVWNQSGGEELLTFENKEPKGCMILFNDGRINFIRLKQIRSLKWDDR